MARRIKLSLGIGLNNCTQEDYEDIPDNWDDMTKNEQDEYLDQAAMDFGNNYIDLGAWVEEYDEESE